KLRVVGRDDQVHRPDQHQPARDAAALHGGDRRLGDVAPALAEAEVDLLFACHAAFGSRRPVVGLRADRTELVLVLEMLALAQIVAGGEVLAVRRDDDHAHLAVVRRLVERIVQLVEQPRVLRVAGLGPVEDDARHVLGGLLDEDRLSFHGRRSFQAVRSASALWMPKNTGGTLVRSPKRCMRPSAAALSAKAMYSATCLASARSIFMRAKGTVLSQSAIVLMS